MSFAVATIARLPRSSPMRSATMIKFAIVGGTTFIIDTAIFYTLADGSRTPPVTAKVIAGIVAIASYVLNREWSFRDRGCERHHDVALCVQRWECC